VAGAVQFGRLASADVRNLPCPSPGSLALTSSPTSPRKERGEVK
jgi:hypothetical protein